MDKIMEPKATIMLKRLFSVVVVLFMVSGCTSKEEQIAKALQQQADATGNTLAQLEKALDDGRIRNSLILKQYADKVKQTNPELGALADALAKDATVYGPIYINLVKRYDEAKNNATAFADWNQRINEMQAINEAAKTTLFNDALTDPINVLADLSNGQLSRVNAISRESEIAANKTEDLGAGAQLVGNPNYGQWQTGSNGTSFWAWYGMYRMVDDLFDRDRRHSYSRWSSNRPYSYYGDYGRTRYSSPKQRAKQQAVYQKTKKSFAARGKSFSGPYSKRRTGASSLSRSSYTPTKKSSFSRKSSYSSGSMRSSSSRTSRGGRGGK